MANTPSLVVTVGHNIPTNITSGNRHTVLSGSFVRSGGELPTVEQNIYYTMRVAGVFSNLFLRCSVNGKTLDTTLLFRKNLANGNMTLTLPASTTGAFEDTTHSDSVIAGDEVDYRMIFPASSANQNFDIISSVFLPSSDTAVPLLGYVSGTVNLTTAVRYQGLEGLLELINATEANAQTKIQTPGTLRYLFINLPTNTSGTVTARIRKNGTNGNSVLVSGSATTGLFEDTVNSDTIAVGDNVCYSLVASTSTGTRAVIITGSTFMTTNNKFFLGGIDANASDGTISFGTTTYMPIGGRPSRNATEQTTKMKVRISKLNLEMLTINITANTVNGSSTVRTRKNGANGAQSVTIGASTTGIFTDSSNIDNGLIGTDDINYQIVTGGSSGTMTLRSASVIGDSTVSTLYNYPISEPSVSVNQTLAKVKKANRTIVETAISVSQILRRNAVRRYSEPSISVNQTLSRPFVRRAIPNTVTVSDSIVKTRFYFRNISEGLVSAAQALARKATRLLSDPSITVGTDSINRMKKANKTVSEPSISVNQTLAKSKNANRNPTEAVPVGQILTKSALKTITETAISVTQILRRNVIRVITEPAITKNDSLVRIKIARRLFLGESVSVFQVIRKSVLHNISEPAITTSDSADAHIMLPQETADTVIVNPDSLGSTKKAIRIFFDFVATDDDIVVRRVIRALVESISKNDSIVRRKFTFRNINDPSVTVGPGVISRLKKAFRFIPNTVPADDDIVVRTALKSRSLTDGPVPNLNDLVIATKQKTRILNNTVNVADSINRQVHFFRDMNDSSQIMTQDIITVTKIYGNEKRSLRMENVPHKLEYTDAKHHFTDNPEIL